MEAATRTSNTTRFIAVVYILAGLAGLSTLYFGPHPANQFVAVGSLIAMLFLVCAIER